LDQKTGFHQKMLACVSITTTDWTSVHDFQSPGCRTGIASFSWPDVIGDPFFSSGPRITTDGVHACAANNAAFDQNFLGHVGNSGPNQFYGPGYVNADLSFIKM
jgi:hypothetical protein